jgi:hypothetical protein
MGCHPLSTVLYLKQVEARSRGERIAVTEVVADVGNVAASLPRKTARSSTPIPSMSRIGGR